MSNHTFHPPSELPTQVLSYVSGLSDHAKEFGTVPMNTPKELAAVKSQAHALEPRWLDELLQREGILDATGEVWLHCYPRVLGCHRPSGQRCRNRPP